MDDRFEELPSPQPGWSAVQCRVCGGEVASASVFVSESALDWHTDWCDWETFLEEVRRREYVRSPRDVRAYDAAGVATLRPPLTAKQRRVGRPRRGALYAPAWAVAVWHARAPYRRRVALLKKLASDPVAAHLVASRPEAIASLLKG